MRPPPKSSAGWRLRSGGAKKSQADYTAARKAERIFGLQDYVTNAGQKLLTGAEVLAAYHSLLKVEGSFRMAESDLKARPIFHHTREAIDAHLALVFCALAVSRHLQSATELSLRKILNTLKPLREDPVEINGTVTTIPAALTPEAKDILNALTCPSGH